MKEDKFEKTLIRLLRQLAKFGSKGARIKQMRISSKIAFGKETKTFDNNIIEFAIAEGLASLQEKFLCISLTGKSKLRRHLCDHDPFLGQHQELNNTTINFQGTNKTVAENCAESPLARLYARKQKDGSRYFSAFEYESGNRLRRDFEKSHIQPSISASWHEGVSSGSKAHGSMQSYEISDLAMDARGRLHAALDLIGPELAGVTLDICCFLKGFETVEVERRWPARSAKLMLKTALASLARHYGYISNEKPGQAKTNNNISHWGVKDYRPTI